MEKNILEYYVGTNDDPRFPGIISGPFEKPPLLTGKNHTLWRKESGRFVRVIHLRKKIIKEQ